MCQHVWHRADHACQDLIRQLRAKVYRSPNFASLWLYTCRVGYGDITPATLAEIWVNICIMIAGLALFASVLSGLAEVVQSSSRQARRTSAIRQKLTEVQACCQLLVYLSD